MTTCRHAKRSNADNTLDTRTCGGGTRFEQPGRCCFCRRRCSRRIVACCRRQITKQVHNDLYVRGRGDDGDDGGEGGRTGRTSCANNYASTTSALLRLPVPRPCCDDDVVASGVCVCNVLVRSASLHLRDGLIIIAASSCLSLASPTNPQHC